MDQLEKRYDLASRALYSLGEALEHLDIVDTYYAHVKDHEDVVHTAIDSVFQRFEYSTHLFLEYFKKYLAKLLGVSKIRYINAGIKKAEKKGVFSQDEMLVLAAIVESRKLLPCSSEGKVAEQLIQQIPGYYKTLSGLIERIKPK